jgi:TetR/AcrR family transcriptional regulator, transcriptional repressor for nem operon
MPRPANPAVRAQLLAAGTDLVHRRGFNGCGVQDITNQAGVPKGSFYYYFASKDALAVEILEAYWVNIEERFGPILSNHAIKPSNRVKRFFRALAQDHKERGFSGGCLIGNLALELSEISDDVRIKIKALMSVWEQRLAECLREAQSLGELDKRRNVIELAAILIEGYEGSVIRGKVEQDWRTCDRFADQVVPRLLAG